jgi:formylmethanofuran:tetrahydromethanopterin formyltransferase
MVMRSWAGGAGVWWSPIVVMSAGFFADSLMMFPREVLMECAFLLPGDSPDGRRTEG